MARSRYATVKIPEELAEALDGACKDWGYRSRAEMVDDAVRLFIARMKGLETSEERRHSRTLAVEKANLA